MHARMRALRARRDELQAELAQLLNRHQALTEVLPWARQLVRGSLYEILCAGVCLSAFPYRGPAKIKSKHLNHAPSASSDARNRPVMCVCDNAGGSHPIMRLLMLAGGGAVCGFNRHH